MNLATITKKITPTKLAVVLLGIFLLATGGVYLYFLALLGPVEEGRTAEVSVNIPAGSSTIAVARTLEQQGLIKSALAFRVYTRYSGQDSSIMAGKYALSSAMSVQDILAKLTMGEVETFSFTIPEGYNAKQIADLLAEKDYVNREKFLALVDEKRLEGYLFPATYRAFKGITEIELLNLMYKRFRQEITPDYEAKAKALGLNLHQAVTLASIIEREAMKDSERPMVAAVFLNRMKIGMKLESCATVQYALGENKERLLYKDLQVDSPYNTYKVTGLPPGPIAAPGRPSLQAAVNPAKVDYLYFVVSKAGEQAFSNTLDEHNKNKRKYISKFQTP